MMYDYFHGLVTGIENTLAAHPEKRSHRKTYALEIARLGRRLYSGDERIAWCGVLAPFDLLNAMGVTSCFVEFIGAMLASTGMIAEFLQEAETKGFAPDTCGYHRAVLGAAHKNLMPKPDFCIATSAPCTGGLAVMENIASMFGKDLFVLNVPQDDSEESVRYLADQFRDMTDFVAKRTGRPLDRDALRRAMELSNQATDIMREAYEIARHVPSPVSGKDLANFGVVMALLLGKPEAVQVAREFKEAFAARVARNEPGVPGERVRLLWIQNRIQFKNDVLDFLEKDCRASIVCDELNAVTWEPIDPDDPFPGLARRAISIPLNGTVERRVENLKKMATEFKIHGAVNPCHWGCRQGTGARGLVAEGLREIGVPVLNLEVDCVDTRNFAPGQIRTRLEAFIEMLTA